MMKIDEIKTIVELMSQHDLTEFRIESDDMQLTMVRGCKAVPVAAPMVVPAPMAAAEPVAVAAPAEPVAVAEPAPSVKLETINAPTIGTFYQSASPDAEPFVNVGTKVYPDTVVCIIEAMKVMNEIKAERTGVIKEILIENGKPVEFGQPLFSIE